MEPNGIPYDVSQIEMRHSGEPGHDWHPAALLRMVADASASSPWLVSPRSRSSLQRRIFARAAAARLGERGFDCDELLRCVFQPMIVGEFLRLSLRVAFDHSRGDGVPPAIVHFGRELQEAVGGAREGESFSGYLNRSVNEAPVRAAARRAAGWVEEAPLRRVLDWRLPSESEWRDCSEAEVVSRECPSRWFADRFLLTYLEDSHTSSLHDEFRWNRDEILTGQVATELIELRRVPQERLNAVVAARAVDGEVHDPRALLTTAVEHLRVGDVDQAVALFQGALAVSPNDWVRNCLAFCLVPVDPIWAELMFRDLLAKSFDPALLQANLAATARLQGNITAAHEHARAGLELETGNEPRTAHLWGFEGDELRLMIDVDVEDYLKFVLSWT